MLFIAYVYIESMQYKGCLYGSVAQLARAHPYNVDGSSPSGTAKGRTVILPLHNDSSPIRSQIGKGLAWQGLSPMCCSAILLSLSPKAPTP